MGILRKEVLVEDFFAREWWENSVSLTDIEKKEIKERGDLDV